jgi:hypothetical protein
LSLKWDVFVEILKSSILWKFCRHICSPEFLQSVFQGPTFIKENNMETTEVVLLWGSINVNPFTYASPAQGNASGVLVRRRDRRKKRKHDIFILCDCFILWLLMTLLQLQGGSPKPEFPKIVTFAFRAYSVKPCISVVNSVNIHL